MRMSLSHEFTTPYTNPSTGQREKNNVSLEEVDDLFYEDVELLWIFEWHLSEGKMIKGWTASQHNFWLVVDLIG